MAASTRTSSTNWAGYADVLHHGQGTFTNVSGSWTVPKLTCTKEDRITSDWVGLDGFSSATVEQDGTASQCFEGTPVYYSWYATTRPAPSRSACRFSQATPSAPQWPAAAPITRSS